MKLSTDQYRILILSQRRGFTDTICWLILFLLIIGFQTVYLLWHQPNEGTQAFIDYVLHIPSENNRLATWPEAFVVILRDSLLYTVGLIIVVYFNLLVIKRSTLDRYQWTNAKRYASYITLVVVTSLVFSLFLSQLAIAMGFVRDSFNFPINILANFSFSLISTGLVHLRTLKEKERNLLKARWKNKKLQTQLDQVKDALKDAQKALAGVAVSEDHLKIGNRTNYQIIPFHQILFFKGEGNEPRIIQANGKKPFAGSTLKDFEDRLPQQHFIRVHRSYIINKNKITGRDGNQLLLADERLEETFVVPISESYLTKIEEDLHPNLSFEEPPPKETKQDIHPIFINKTLVS